MIMLLTIACAYVMSQNIPTYIQNKYVALIIRPWYGSEICEWHYSLQLTTVPNVGTPTSLSLDSGPPVPKGTLFTLFNIIYSKLKDRGSGLLIRI